MIPPSHIIDAPEAESQLVNWLQNGDQQNFSKLFDWFSPVIFGIIRKWVKDPETSKDLLQDVFIKAWRNRKLYDAGKGRLFTWLYRIARNICIDHLRSKSYRYRYVPEINDSMKTTVTGMSSATPDTIGLNKLVEGLESEEKRVVDLMHFKGFTQRQVAEIMDIPLGTVKTRMRRAMQQLRYFYKKDWKRATDYISIN